MHCSNQASKLLQVLPIVNYDAKICHFDQMDANSDDIYVYSTLWINHNNMNDGQTYYNVNCTVDDGWFNFVCDSIVYYNIYSVHL